MDIVTVKGEKDSGKTSFITYVLVQLLAKGAKVIDLEMCGCRNDDFKAKIHFNDKTVILCSIGDAVKYIREGLEFAREGNGKIYVNALSETKVNEDDYKKLLQESEQIIKTISRKKESSDKIRQANMRNWKEIVPLFQ